MATYCVSTDGESYHGSFGTREEAIAEGVAMCREDDCRTFWVGESVPPTPPESLFDAGDWLEHVSCQDAYGGDWADDWDRSTAAQRAELEREVQSVMAAWLDRHGLRPTFFCVENELHYHGNGEPVGG